MNTATISAEINPIDIPVLKTILKKFKAKKIVVEEKDDTKMSKEEYFAMIDEARKEKEIKMSLDEMIKLLDE